MKPLSNKHKKILNFIVGPLIFFITSYFIYKQLDNKKALESQWEHIANHFTNTHYWQLVFVILLMIVNWALETKKWLISIKDLQTISFLKAFKSILSGVAFTMITPNRTGEFVGRVLYIDEGNRIRAALLTLTTSISQTIVTILLGIIGFFIIQEEVHQIAIANINWWVNGILIISILFVVACLYCYFNMTKVIRAISRYRFFHRFNFFIKPLLKLKTDALNSIFLLSILRYFVFAWQYYLLLQVFGVEIAWVDGLSIIAVFYLAMAIIPSFALAELGIRGSLSLTLFGLFSTNSLGILLASTAIWLINVILPAAIGAVLVINIKLFKKNIEENEQIP